MTRGLLILLFCAGAAHAQVYRWVDAKGTVHYSDAPPPSGVKSTRIEIDTRPGPASADSIECYTVRCQGERMEERLRRREAADARFAAERAASAPKPVRGLEFRAYIRLYRGMTEGELIGIAGEPDFISSSGGWGDRRSYTYMPTSADPFTTTVMVFGGRVNEIERVRKF